MKLNRFPPRAALWATLALALALRVVGCIWWQSRLEPGQRFEFGDSETYWVLASHIAHGEAYEYGSPDVRIFRMPGYPIVLAGLLRLFGDDMPVLYARTLSALFGTMAVAGVYWLAAMLYDRRTGVVAALLAACYPGAIAMSVVVLSEAPFCPLYLAQLAAWLKSWRANDDRSSVAGAELAEAGSPLPSESAGQRCPGVNMPTNGMATGASPRSSPNAESATCRGSAPATSRVGRRRKLTGSSFVWAAVSGMFGGLATLMRPDWLLFVPFAGLAGFAFTRDRLRHLKTTLVMCATVVAVMTPWWWRNFKVCSEFVPTTLQVGASLYDGLNAKATGASDMWFVSEYVDLERRQPSAANRAFESRLDRRLWHAALEWSAQHPARVLSLAASKLLRMWNVWPNDPQHRGGLMKPLTASTFLPVIVLAFIGIWQTRAAFWPAAICWLPAVYLTLLHLVFVSSIRYREPPMLALLVFTAAAITRGIRPSSAQ